MSGRVAFVVQRCGLEVNGGAELLCRMVAERLARHLPVEGLGELRIRRFPVERPRDVDSFNRLSESMRARKGKLSIAEQEAWIRVVDMELPFAEARRAHERLQARENFGKVVLVP